MWPFRQPSLETLVKKKNNKALFALLEKAIEDPDDHKLAKAKANAVISSCCAINLKLN